MDIRPKMDQIVSDIEADIRIVTTELQKCPEGRLLRTQNNGKTVVYHVTGSGSARIRKTITKDRDAQVALAKRTVLEEYLKRLNTQLGIVSNAAARLSVLEDLDKMRIASKQFTWFTNKEISSCCSIEQDDGWENLPYPRLAFHPEALRHATSRGLMMRSKSEVMIAEALYRWGLPFRYEQTYTVEGKQVVSADFTLRRRDGKIFVWEHEGLINTSAYIERQRRKAELFAKLGFVPWDNLIISYDTADGALDLRIVESEIRNKLLV